MKTVYLCISFLALTAFANVLYATEWPECRRTKLESLKLQQALRKGSLLRGYNNRGAMREAMRDNDKWLWRECRRYSGELRDLAAK